MAIKNVVGPTPTDVIYASKLAKFLSENPELAEWLCEKFKTPQGRSELEALTRIELRV